jgi:hypothetical protein
VAEVSRKHLAVARALGESHTAAVVLAGAALKELYSTLRLGGGVFRSRGMAKELEAQTLVELWTYVAALLVSMVEKPPASPEPGDLEPMLVVFEGMLIDVRGAAYRSAYEAYRRRYRERRSSLGVPDPGIFGETHGLHQLFCERVALLWAIPSSGTIAPFPLLWTTRAARANRTSQAFIGVAPVSWTVMGFRVTPPAAGA